MLPFFKQNPDGIIIADRYTTANMVNQAGKIKDEKERDKFLDWLWNFEFNMYKIPVPDKVIFLNMPVKYSEELMKNRNNKITGQIQKDIHEKDESHLQDAYNAACYVSKKYNWCEIKCVENGQISTIEEIHNEVYNNLNF